MTAAVIAAVTAMVTRTEEAPEEGIGFIECRIVRGFRSVNDDGIFWLADEISQSGFGRRRWQLHSGTMLIRTFIR
jgi:hypothetical protein